MATIFRAHGNDLVSILAMPGEAQAQYVATIADRALEKGESLVIVGVSVADPSNVYVCNGQCCAQLEGTVVLIPDVVEAEIVANGVHVPEDEFRITRGDGRTLIVVSGGRP
jgi:hypothetical protein